MSTTTKILEDKIELINWITELNDNKVLDKLRFLMENYKPKEVITSTEEVTGNEVQGVNNDLDQEETQKNNFSTPQLTDADEEAFQEETKRRFPHLFKD